LRRFVLAFSLFFLAANANAAIPSSERDALITFYNATNGASWTKNTNWLGAPGTECTWFGIVCNSGQTHVTSISMVNNQVSGPLPEQINGLPSLQGINLEHNLLTGQIPQSIGSLPSLTFLNLIFNRLTGPIPVSLLNDSNLNFIRVGLNDLDGNDFFAGAGALTKLTSLDLSDCKLRGLLPTAALMKMKSLGALYLSNNQLTGPLAPELATLPLNTFTVDHNRFDGTIQPGFGQLKTLTIFNVTSTKLTGPIPSFASTQLQQLNIGGNDFTGPLPTDWPSTITSINVYSNRFTGPIPPQIATLPKLGSFVAYDNQLSGPIPVELGQSQSITWLDISNNLLSGPVPAELAQMRALKTVEIAGCAFRGEFPKALVNSTIQAIHLQLNALYATDPDTKAWLDRVSAQKTTWPSQQTVAPTNVAVTGTTAFSATLTWTPIEYAGGPGGYQVLVSTTPGGPYVPKVTTSDKWQKGTIVPGLSPSSTYYAIVKSISYANGRQPNTLFSDPTAEISFTTSAAVTSSAQLVATVLPQPIIQAPNTAGATTTYRVTNVGGSPALVTVTQQGDFFTQPSAAFTLNGGESQTITLTGLAKPEGTYDGTTTASAAGTSITVPVRLVSAVSSGSTSLTVSENRIDLVSSGGRTIGTFFVTNSGSTSFIGVIGADVEWIIPPATILNLLPGESRQITITVDPAKRPDPSLLTGTVTGSVQILTLTPRIGKKSSVAGSSSTAATVTVSLTTVVLPGASSIPPLKEGEVAWFAPGVGHVVSSVGLFLSDISILNAFGSRAIDDMKLFYKPAQNTNPLLATLGSLPVSQSLVIGDVVKNVFGGDAQVGTMQVRTKDWQTLSIAANVFNVSNPLGTYGTSIPIFRSDRAASSADKIYLTGMRRSDTSHTNIFLQETTGQTATATIDFFDAAGHITSSRTESVEGFALKQLNFVGDSGSVMARVTPADGSHLHAYATPVDQASGDNWSVADWSRQFSYEPSEPVMIPVAGSVNGANDTHFQTDVSITNIECVTKDQRDKGQCGTTDVSLTYRTTGGEVIEKTLTIDPFQTISQDDIATTLFNAVGTIGHIVIRPSNGNLAITSRTYTTKNGTPATFGSGVPALALSSALRPGQFRIIAGLDDANGPAIAARTPATYRNNVGLVETRGEPLTVRVTLSYLDAQTRVTANVSMLPMVPGATLRSSVCDDVKS